MGTEQKSHSKMKFDHQLNAEATIQREKVKGTDVEVRNKQLKDIGSALNPLPDNLKYMGSAAMHVYYNETLQQAVFINQTNTMRECNEALAIAGFRDFAGTLMETFGQKRPVKRSGF